MTLTIGMTYDLRSEYLAMGYSLDETAEFDKEETITAIESTLSDLGHRPERIGHARQLAAALLSGKRWDLVFNIAEGMHGMGREALVPALLDLYGIPYTFSDPLVMSLTLHKGMTKRVIRDAGVPTADFFVAQDAGDAGEVSFDPPFFVKPVAEGTGKGISAASIVRNREGLEAACAYCIRTYRQPAIIEPYLSGREFTAGIIGTGKDARILGIMEVHLKETAEPGVYSYVNKEEFEDRVTYRLIPPNTDPAASEAEAVSLAAWRVLGCRDAGRVDIRCDANGKAQFMEVNPLAGIHPHHSDLPIICNLAEIPYRSLIDGIVSSAMSRIRGS
jgi:D-alanine-D-alanine ligase